MRAANSRRYLTVQVFFQVFSRYTEGTRALVGIVTLTLVPRQPRGLFVTLPVERVVVTLHSLDDFSGLGLRLHVAVTDRGESVPLGFTPARLTMVVLARGRTLLLFVGETLSFRWEPTVVPAVTFGPIPGHQLPDPTRGDPVVGGRPATGNGVSRTTDVMINSAFDTHRR